MVGGSLVHRNLWELSSVDCKPDWVIWAHKIFLDGMARQEEHDSNAYEVFKGIL
jgi:hypothetical protein